jgi:hypothetical protein
MGGPWGCVGRCARAQRLRKKCTQAARIRPLQLNDKDLHAVFGSSLNKNCKSARHSCGFVVFAGRPLPTLSAMPDDDSHSIAS